MPGPLSLQALQTPIPEDEPEVCFTLQAFEPCPNSDADYNSQGGPTSNGQTIIAIDVTHFGGASEHSEAIFESILTETSGGSRLPSSRRYTARERTPSEGIVVGRGIYDEINGILAMA